MEGEGAPAESVTKWTGFYASGFSPWDSHRPASQLVSFLRGHPEGRRLLPASRHDAGATAEALEIGCGTGATCVWMAQCGMKVVGVDLVPQPLATASSDATSAGVADRCCFLALDFMSLPDNLTFAVAKRMADGEKKEESTQEKEESAPGGFDLVYDCQCFHVLRKEIGEKPVAEKIARMVKPGGFFFTLVGNCNEEMRGPERLTRTELIYAFSPWFDVVTIYETRFDMTEHYKTLPQPPLAWCGIFKKK